MLRNALVLKHITDYITHGMRYYEPTFFIFIIFFIANVTKTGINRQKIT